MFADQVKSGALPPVDKRIPEAPSIVKQFAGGDGPGRSGGQVNMLVANARDTRLMTLYANARLIVYDDQFKLQPDILESYEAKDGREFTLKLRAGHKWSDGQPFTTEDFRFFWEDVANNKELSPSGPSVELLVDGKPPKVEIIDAADHQVTPGTSPTPTSSKARRAPRRSSCSGRRTTSRSSTASTRPAEEIAKAAKGGQGGSWVQIYRRRRRDVRQRQSRPADAQRLGS